MFSILQWNMKGYYNNLYELQTLIKDASPSIISIQETYIPFSSNPPHPSKQYNTFLHNLPQSTNAKQELAVLVKKNISHKLIPINSDISVIALEIDFIEKFTIVSLYIPPQQQFSSSQINYILSLITTPIILIGDVNAWSLLWGSASTNIRGQILEDIILCSDLIVLNDGSPTHFSTHKTFSNIDITLCSSSLSPKCTWSILDDLHGSDHFPIVTKLHLGPKTDYLKPKPKFKLDEANWKKYQKIIDVKLLHSEISEEVNNEAAKIQKIIRFSAHNSIPQTKNRPTKFTTPWWSNVLSELREIKQSAWYEFRRCRSDFHLIAYKKANAKFRYTAKNAKKESLEKFTASINPLSKPRKIWADIKMLSGNFKNSNIQIINTINGVLTTPTEISNHFANHWSNYSKDSNFSPEFVSDKKTFLNSNYTPINKLSFNALEIEKPITSCEFELVLSKAKGKTPGFDRISYPLIKNLPDSIKSRLIMLYNKIFIKSIIPQSWKAAIIIPIPKPNKAHSEINGYRPISLISCMSKVMEKIIATRLMWFISKNMLLSPNQVAFKKYQGTTDVLLTFDNYVCNSISAKNHITVLSLDFEKAFDRIGAHVVLRQLKSWNVGKRIFNYVKNFLFNRKIRVLVNNFTSKTQSLNNGIPQGSPLSVVLFIIAFDETSKIISKYNKVEHSIYADDIIIYSKLSNLNELKCILISILHDLSIWALSSGANISYEKCLSFHICNKTSCNNFKISFNNTNIVNTDSLKILGVYFDKRYTFKTHCIYIRNELNIRLNIIKYLSSKHAKVHPATLLNATRALILSKIDYGLPIYGKCAKTNLKLIQPSYNAAVRRSIRAFPTSQTTNLLAECGLPSIPDRVNATTHRLLPKLLCTPNNILSNDFKKTQSRKTTPKRQSTIFICSQYLKDNNISPFFNPSKTPKYPPWNISESSIIKDLISFQKSHTDNETYHKLFLEIKSSYKSWQFLFTDGSKTSHLTSYAVVKENGNILSCGYLEPFCSVFSAESVAILKAVEVSSLSKGKFIICTDSQSAVNAIANAGNSNTLISNIRDKLIKHPNKIKIMWIPGHAGIVGNEFADKAANQVSLTPTLLNCYVGKKDWLNLFNNMEAETIADNWTNYTHRYKAINPSKEKLTFPSSCNSDQIKVYIRLRLGHTKITHEHLLCGNAAPSCPTQRKFYAFY